MCNQLRPWLGSRNNVHSYCIEAPLETLSLSPESASKLEAARLKSDVLCCYLFLLLYFHSCLHRQLEVYAKILNVGVAFKWFMFIDPTVVVLKVQNVSVCHTTNCTLTIRQSNVVFIVCKCGVGASGQNTHTLHAATHAHCCSHSCSSLQDPWLALTERQIPRGQHMLFSSSAPHTR